MKYYYIKNQAPDPENPQQYFEGYVLRESNSSNFWELFKKIHHSRRGYDINVEIVSSERIEEIKLNDFLTLYQYRGKTAIYRSYSELLTAYFQYVVEHCDNPQFVNSYKENKSKIKQCFDYLLSSNVLPRHFEKYFELNKPQEIYDFLLSVHKEELENKR